MDRWVWLAMLITAVVVIPRSVLILRAHNEYVDDSGHVRQGLALLTRNPANTYMMMNDPPGGDAIAVLPMVVMGCFTSNPIDWDNWPGGKPAVESGASPNVAWHMRTSRVEALYGHRLRPETILMMIGVWKAILFVPFGGLVFYWCRRLYGMKSGWLGLGLVLVDPSIAGNIPPVAVDVLAVEAIVLALFAAWRYFEKLSTGRLIGAAILTALAMLIKQTALILPGVILIYAAMYWVVLPWMQRQPWERWKAQFRGRVNAVLLAALVGCGSIWAFTLFDVSPPRQYWWPMTFAHGGGFSFGRDVLDPLLDMKWPAGVYIGSVLGAIKHASLGHWNYLWGEYRERGWWYYFPVLATYKVPVGIGIVVLLALVSLWRVRPRWGELALLIPMLAWLAVVMSSSVNIGFRHFLPVYIFVLMLASRCVSSENRAGSGWVLLAAWVGVAGAFLHSLTFHPDYLSYINWPRDKVWLQINDSNIDWGQGLKEVRTWLDEHPQNGRKVYLGYFWERYKPAMGYYLGDRVVVLNRHEPQPTSGLLIISPGWVASLYDYFDAYGALRPIEPKAIIGHSMLVYDLDELMAQGKLKWTHVETPAP